MIAKNALEIYDFYILSELQKKLTAVVNTKWIISPPDLTIALAKEQFGTDTIFPLYSIFRNEPVIKADDGSYANYRLNYAMSEEKSIQQILVKMQYQIDFWSKNLYEMNMCNIDYLKFQTDKTLSFNFSEIGLPELTENYEAEIIIDDITSNHAIDDMFNIGRYFRYTYDIYLTGLLFDVVDEVKFDTIVFGLYHNNLDNKIFELEKEV